MKVNIYKTINLVAIIIIVLCYQNVAFGRNKKIEKQNHHNQIVQEKWEKESLKLNKKENKKIYKDGEFEGSGNGFGGEIVVLVTMKNDHIKDIKIIKSNGETPEYISEVKDKLPKQIISKDSTDVDVVSGATLSSNGVLSAVENAIDKSKIK